MTTKQRDPSTLTDADLPSMTRAERAAYYEANAHRLDELFDDSRKVAFEPDPKGSDLIVSVRLKHGEADTLTAAAREAGKPLSVYLRESALTAATGGAPAHRDLRLEDLDPEDVEKVKAWALVSMVKSSGLTGVERAFASFAPTGVLPKLPLPDAFSVSFAGPSTGVEEGRHLQAVVREKGRTRAVTTREAAEIVAEGAAGAYAVFRSPKVRRARRALKQERWIEVKDVVARKQGSNA
ncbi:hypothetical protein [Isoptericola sp. NPDC057391]|uniref:hypothetical protein n=1 Tax=Isoptericola sp. NPDC057391 TaxID=3346117 RepID=UPI0036412949